MNDYMILYWVQEGKLLDIASGVSNICSKVKGIIWSMAAFKCQSLGLFVFSCQHYSKWIFAAESTMQVKICPDVLIHFGKIKLIITQSYYLKIKSLLQRLLQSILKIVIILFSPSVKCKVAGQLSCYVSAALCSFSVSKKHFISCVLLDLCSSLETLFIYLVKHWCVFQIFLTK